MKHFTILLLFGMIFLAADCSNDNPKPADTGTLELTFKGTFDKNPLVMYTREYPYEAGMKMKLQLFRFYLSDIIIASEGASPVSSTIQDIAIVDFEDIQSDAQAQQGITIKIDKVPSGNYNNVKFGIGVNEKLNGTQPGDYEPGHPLSDNYWSWALGYVFTKIEGNADIDGDGIFSDKLTFHIGGNPYYRNKAFNQTFTVKPGETTRLNFEVDLHKVLVKTESDFLDFRKVTIDHTNNKDVATFISDNMVNAIEMK